MESHQSVIEEFQESVSFVVNGQSDARSRAEALHSAKPHISEEDAEQAVITIDRWRHESHALRT